MLSLAMAPKLVTLLCVQERAKQFTVKMTEHFMRGLQLRLETVISFYLPSGFSTKTNNSILRTIYYLCNLLLNSTAVIRINHNIQRYKYYSLRIIHIQNFSNIIFGAKIFRQMDNVQNFFYKTLCMKKYFGCLSFIYYDTYKIFQHWKCIIYRIGTFNESLKVGTLEHATFDFQFMHNLLKQ